MTAEKATLKAEQMQAHGDTLEASERLANKSRIRPIGHMNCEMFKHAKLRLVQCLLNNEGLNFLLLLDSKGYLMNKLQRSPESVKGSAGRYTLLRSFLCHRVQSQNPVPPQGMVQKTINSTGKCALWDQWKT